MLVRYRDGADNRARLQIVAETYQEYCLLKAFMRQYWTDTQVLDALTLGIPGETWTLEIAPQVGR